MATDSSESREPDFTDGQLLRLFVGERDMWHGRALYEAIVDLLRKRGIAGASVFRGIEGFGSHHEIHVASVFRFHDNLPILIEVIDNEQAIAELIPALDAMMTEGTMTLERVQYRRFLPAREQPKKR